jgi:phage terminase small subunit
MPPKINFESIIGGRSHRSKQELKDRADTEIELGGAELVLPAHVRKNRVALKKWKELVKLYKSQKIELVTSADSDIVAQFCICHSELCTLTSLQDDMSKVHKSNGTSVLDIIDDMNKVDNMINKKREAHSKLATKLLLDPVSRIRAIPLKQPEKKKSSVLDVFDITG